MSARATAARGPRVLVIYKKSAYQIYVRERKNARIQELLDADDDSVHRLRHAHEDHSQALEEARGILAGLGARAVFRYRSDAGTSEAFDLVLTLGGDGTLLWASHRVSAQIPIVAINTAPEDSVGYFCAGTKHTMGDVLDDALAGRLTQRKLTRMHVSVDGEAVHNRVLNDVLFAHECPAATARYVLFHGDEAEEQKTSGLWVGPAAGSTAAQKSAGGQVMPIGSRRLQYVVREPYALGGKPARLTRGYVGPSEELRVQSRIRAGRLYVDGPHLGRVIDMGSELVMRASDEPLLLLGFRGRERTTPGQAGS